MKKRGALLLIFLIALLICVFCGGAAGLRPAEPAKPRTEKAAQNPSESVRVIFQYESKTYTYEPNPRGGTYLSKAELDKRGYYLPQEEKAELLKKITKIGFSKEEAVRYVFFGIDDVVKRMEKEINREPVDSKVSFRPNSSPMFSFSAEREGFLVERAALYSLLYSRLSRENKCTVTVPVTVLKPEHSRAYWKKNICERASFSTGYAGSSPDRKHNVALALRSYNGLTVQPGQIVSFNKLVGSRSEARGYRSAKIILDGAYEDGVGGGVCQSSTTLYNALLLAGLKITKRSPHSLTSSYVSPGFDAMVNMGSADLEFENDTDAPIYIKTTADESRVTVKIYGARPEYKIIRRKQIVETVEPPPVKIIFDFEGKYADKVFFSDEYYRMQAPKQGLTADAYLDYYKGGKLIKSEKLHTDKYKPAQGVYVYGTRMRPPPPPPEPEPQYFYPIN